MSEDHPKIVSETARYGVRLNHVIFPLDFTDLRRSLAKNGYELAPVNDMPITPSRIRYGGSIGRKGEETVFADSDTNEIGIIGRSLQAAFSSFEDLANLIKNELGIDLHENVKFYWAVSNFKISTGKTPRQVLAKIANKECVDKFSQIIGIDLSSYTLRLGTKDASPNRDNWFEVSIEPDLVNDRLYYVGSVFRKPIRSDTETFVKSFENSLMNLIRAIEV